jgi:DNA-binding transcriptional LysR family regulator
VTTAMKTTLITQLQAFRLTTRCGTVSAAAQQLNVSQPAVSRALHRLEQSLGLTLFDRRQGRLVPTPEALILLDHVEHGFHAFDKIRDVITDIRRAHVGRLHIAATHSLCSQFLPQVICSFRQRHPRVAITVEMQSSCKIEDWAFSQAIDFGLSEMPLRRQDLDAELFCRAPMYLIVPEDHHLATRNTAGPEDLIGQPLVTFMRNEQSCSRLDDLLQAEGISKTMLVETQNYAMICEFVSQGAGIGFSDPFTACAYRDRGLVMVPFLPKLDFSIALLHPVHRVLSRAASCFLAELRTHKTRFLEQLPHAETSITRATAIAPSRRPARAPAMAVPLSSA